ncbi:mating type protein MAT1-2-1 [Aspergillus pseudonomiae]|uniref:Mating type protein MAT1-2-1 n=1 Tax=Aspergillus pseudonomiae TaxID=1506151 RepID=A0A5N7DDN1_9EURO|nr:mating type protein MAT1-2-1 [Aspergillus pseudonomiae]KAE8403848.1 mating type protein MAT1-2-1 [Aspergillus pseudonomiae]
MTMVPIAMKTTAESTDKLTELLWQDALRHLESTNNEVLLPINVTDMIGQSNVDKIRTRLGALIGAPVVAFVDETINALRVMRTPAFSGSVVSVASHDRISNLEREITETSGRTHGKSALPAKFIKVPRPPNAFILYRQHHHPRIKEAYPDFTNNEISIILGKQWKAESEEVKMQFRNMAEELKKKHAEDHPDYHYTPRKPSEKKRRASSRQYPKPTKRQKSPALTNDTSDSSTPSMYSGMQLDNMPMDASLDNLGDIDIVLSPDELPGDYGLQFDSGAFDTFLQQVQSDCGKTAATLFPQFNFTERPVGESFEFSDLIADCY